MDVRVGDELLTRYVVSRTSKKRISKKTHIYAASWLRERSSKNDEFRNVGELLLVKAGDGVYD